MVGKRQQHADADIAIDQQWPSLVWECTGLCESSGESTSACLSMCHTYTPGELQSMNGPIPMSADNPNKPLTKRVMVDALSQTDVGGTFQFDHSNGVHLWRYSNRQSEVAYYDSFNIDAATTLYLEVLPGTSDCWVSVNWVPGTDASSSPVIGASASLSALSIVVHKKESPPDMLGLLVKSGDTDIYDLTDSSGNLVTLPSIPQSAITWECNQLRGDGTFKGWGASWRELEQRCPMPSRLLASFKSAQKSRLAAI